LNPFIEIEALDEDLVKNAADKLGFEWSEAIFGSVTVAYRRQYPAITAQQHISQIPEIKFNLPKPDWFEKGK
jgi:hypothetical protein